MRYVLRSFETYVYCRTISSDPLYVAPTQKQLVTDATRRYRIRQRVGSVPHAGQLATDSRWTRLTTSVVPSGGSAHILQNDRVSTQHVVCYIHSTRGSGKKLRSTRRIWLHQNNTLTTVQPLSHQLCADRWSEPWSAHSFIRRFSTRRQS